MNRQFVQGDGFNAFHDGDLSPETELRIAVMRKKLLADGVLKPGPIPAADCANCYYQQNLPCDSGHCYMFSTCPGDHCAQFKLADQGDVPECAAASELPSGS